MVQRMSIWGVGPEVGRGTALFAVAAIGLQCLWPEVFRFLGVPLAVRVALGTGLLLVAFPWYVVAVRAMLRAHRQQRLLTGGIYALCRHPIYAGWILLIWPGVALLADSWLLLIVAVGMYGFTRHHLRREEANLEAQFGADYVRYRQRVGAIFPKFWRS